MREGEARGIYAFAASEIAQLAPLGVGKRDDVWDAVDVADRKLVAEIATWVETGKPVDKVHVRQAFRALIAAWKAACGA